MNSAATKTKRSIFHLTDMVAFYRQDATRRIAISILIGAVSGLGAIAFFVALEWSRWFCLAYLAGAPAPEPAGEQLVHLVAGTPYRPWLLFLIPAIGGLISGLVVYTFAPEAEGHGMDAMISAFHNLKGFIRTRVPFIKAFASIVTLATGGSAGREGPIAQIGAGFGSWVSRMLRLSVQERRIFMLAGCAGGLGAIFRAPLGAAITSVEVLYREDFESEAIIPCVISSVIAFSIFTFVFGFDPIFATPGFVAHDPRQLAIFAVLGLVCAPVGGLYVKVFYGTRDAFRRLSIPKHFRPMLGGLGVGAIALFIPQAIGGGYGYLQLAIYGQLSILIMCLAATAKIATTSLTIGSGGSGGVFGPTLFIGGMIGGVVGQLGHMLFPEIVTQPGAYVLVGMAAFFSGAAKAPLGALIMVTEMTQSYALLPPLMLVSVIAILFNRGSSIYEMQVANKFQSPAHQGDLTVNVMEELTVGQVFKSDKPFHTLSAATPFAQLRQAVAASGQAVYPVTDNQGTMIGLLSMTNIRTVIFEDALKDLVVVGELCTPPISLSLDQSLYDALLVFLESGYGQLPVMEQKDGQMRILGMLDHSEVNAAYHREVSRRMSED
ncbi:MAG: chloride channel protein [Desulfarculaceae bacterium]|nr:chloride channel protein [Desulfarculaceae bacterium]MCF8046281.1 chloride channel protein [Desulfarculaceae bacterium]MCF8064971.1 chloride channel protein [Desulfarculaceae bacterium]MCF8097497.1 chloride channel protein [Desulfarculaceae bacterium]MCF8120936.1 chloride channel protein [Desulfarculaceae bacterium]